VPDGAHIQQCFLGRIVTSVGAFTTFPFGTVAAIVRRGTTVGSFNCIGNIAGPLLDTYINTSTNKLGMLWNGGVSDIPAPTITVTSAEGFVFVAVSKATGTVAPRYHKYVYGTNTWTHESSGTTAANNVTAVSAINIGAVSASTDNFNGDIAAYAAFASVVLTDSQLESMAFALSAWTALKPTGMWVLDQADTAQKVLDWTGGGANESSSTGTTVATTSVPILGYGHPVIIAAGHSVASGTTYSATGSADGAGTATATSTMTEVATGTAAGVGTTAGTEALTIALTGTAAGVGTTAGTEALTIPMTGTADGTGTTSGTESLTIALTGTAAGTGVTSGTEALTIAVSGTVAGAGTTSATEALTIPVSGTVAGSGTTSATEALTIPLTGSTDGSGTTAGAGALTIPVSGTADGTGDVSATGALTIGVTGTTDGTGTTSGSLAIGGTTYAASGTADGTGAASGLLTSVTTTPTGSWWTLASIMREGRTLLSEGDPVSLLMPVTAGPSGSQWTLGSILTEGRTLLAEDRSMQPVACPNDGEPLLSGPRGELYCPYDGWRWQG
jgi:hypothetical protein